MREAHLGECRDCDKIEGSLEKAGIGMTIDVVTPHISKDPKVLGGKPNIAGRRIRVMDVAIWHEKFGWSPDSIASKFNLTLPEVHAALAYYFANREAMDADILADAEFVAELKRRYPSKLPGQARG
jgi:uncharacterized protein (DUF433 family)